MMAFQLTATEKQMGWWSEDIMGGDGPCDIQCMFDREFGTRIDEEDEWGEYELPAKVAGNKVIDFADKAIKDYFDFEEVWQAIGYIMIDAGMPMTDSVRKKVLRATDSEIEGGAESWCSPEGRLEKLREFRAIVDAYPSEGGRVEMPHQTGLFEKFAQMVSQ
jgi:hypothetical protein